MTRPGETLIAALEPLPSVRVKVAPGRGSAGVYVDVRRVADIDLDGDAVLVYSPAETIPTLLGVFPSSRPVAEGIAFDLSDAGHCAEALAAIRRRAHVETLVPQFRESSP
jgi:hypothetical protein